MLRHIFLAKKRLSFHNIYWKHIKSQLASLEKEDCGFILSKDIFKIVKWRVVTSMQSQDDIQSSGVCMCVCVLLQNIFIHSVFPLEYSRVTFSLLVSGEMNFDKGVAVIVLSKSRGMKTRRIPTLPTLMGSDLIQ